MKNESVLHELYDREWNKEGIDEAMQELDSDVGFEQCQMILNNLNTLRAYFEKHAESRRSEHIKAVRQEMVRLAQESGVSLEELFPVKGKRGQGLGRPKGKGEVAYRNPDNPA